MDIQHKKITVPCPSNTLKEKEERASKVKKPVATTAKKRKKSFGKQFAELFVGADGGSMSTYLIRDIVVPTAKGIIRDVTEAITDAIKNGIEMQLFGEHSNRKDSRRGGYGPSRGTNYSSYSNSSYTNSKSRSSENRSTSKNKHFDDVYVDSHSEANAVIRELVAIIDEYGQATVEDLQDLVNITGEFTDSYYGWYNLNTARVRSGRDGYLIDLPRPVYLR